MDGEDTMSFGRVGSQQPYYQQITQNDQSLQDPQQANYADQTTHDPQQEDPKQHPCIRMSCASFSTAGFLTDQQREHQIVYHGDGR